MKTFSTQEFYSSYLQANEYKEQICNVCQGGFN